LDYSVGLMSTPRFFIDGQLQVVENPITGGVLVENISQITGKITKMFMGIDFNSFMDSYDSWKTYGEPIQWAFERLSADEREFVKTGITPQEWDAMFAE
jgi:hypothetical protein